MDYIQISGWVLIIGLWLFLAIVRICQEEKEGDDALVAYCIFDDSEVDYEDE